MEAPLAGMGLPNRNDKLWTTLRFLLKRTWFNRLWVIQEVVLAQHMIVLYGRKRVE